MQDERLKRCRTFQLTDFLQNSCFKIIFANIVEKLKYFD